jgi:hypothetical protein
MSGSTDDLNMPRENDQKTQQLARLQKKRGVWVYHSGRPLTASTVQKTIEQVRRARDQWNFYGKITMPELSRFFGIIIRMFYSDHEPAHFHAWYGSLRH